MVQPSPVPVSAPARVAERLRAAADGPRSIVHAGPDAVYVDLDGRCLGVLSARARAVPCALRTGLEVLRPPRTAEVREGRLLLDGTAYVVGRIVHVGVPRLADRPGDLGALRTPVADLVGAGAGLTPYGDDVLCGWLAAHRALGRPTPDADRAVRGLLPRTTLLSATLLDCALHGEVLPEYAAYLTALGTPAEPAATDALVAVGGSSGAGLLEGARWALAA